MNGSGSGLFCVTVSAKCIWSSICASVRINPFHSLAQGWLMCGRQYWLHMCSHKLLVVVCCMSSCSSCTFLALGPTRSCEFTVIPATSPWRGL